MTMRCIIDVHVVDETRVMSTCLYSMFFSLLYITFQFLKTYGPAQGSLIYLHQSFFQSQLPTTNVLTFDWPCLRHVITLSALPSLYFDLSVGNS